MPFTLAHGAAAIPFRRCRLVLSALLIGTFAPDFEYFLRLSPDDRFGHTLVGSLLLTLPLALLVLWLFHRYVKLRLVSFLPNSIQRRLADDLEAFRFGGPRRFALIVVSTMLGIATHIVWDLFTHPGTWLWYHWPFLSQRVHLPAIGLIPWYKLLQHGSTILGVAALSIWVTLWYRSTSPSERLIDVSVSQSRKIVFVTIVSIVGLVGAVIRSVAGIGIPGNHAAEKRFLGDVVVTTIALAWWQLVAYGMLKTTNSEMPATPDAETPVSRSNGL